MRTTVSESETCANRPEGAFAFRTENLNTDFTDKKRIYTDLRIKEKNRVNPFLSVESVFYFSFHKGIL